MKNKSRIFYWYIIFALLYSAFTFLTAPVKATLTQYHLSAAGLRLLDLTIVVPIIAIWFAAFYGYHKLHRYSQLIDQSKDGKHISKISKGISVLVIGLPVSSIAKQALDLIASHHEGFTAAAAIVSNYIAMLFPLAAFVMISWGTRGLNTLSKKRPSYLASQLLTLILIVSGVLYGYFVSRPSAHIGEAYHLPLGWVLATLVIPYVYTWFLGIVAAYEIHLYSQSIAGVIYRKSWDLVAYSLGAIIVVSILLQYLGTLSVQLKSLSLGWILAVVYALLILLSAGYVLLAFGAKKLIKIEEV